MHLNWKYAELSGRMNPLRYWQLSLLIYLFVWWIYLFIYAIDYWCSDGSLNIFSDAECQTTFPEYCCDDDAADYGNSKTENCNVMLEAAQCSELCTVDNETLSEDDINVEFPSLKAAALIHKKKHESCPASQARKFRLSRPRTSEMVASRHSSTGDQSEEAEVGCLTKTPESIPPCNPLVESLHSMESGLVLWTELRRKSSSSDSDVAILPRRKFSADRELERPVIGIGSSHSDKPLTSTGMVLADFLQPEQVPALADEQVPEFVPMTFCTLCGSRTHNCRECSRQLGETFVDWRWYFCCLVVITPDKGGGYSLLMLCLYLWSLCAFVHVHPTHPQNFALDNAKFCGWVGGNFHGR